VRERKLVEMCPFRVCDVWEPAAGEGKQSFFSSFFFHETNEDSKEAFRLKSMTLIESVLGKKKKKAESKCVFVVQLTPSRGESERRRIE